MCSVRAKPASPGRALLRSGAKKLLAFSGLKGRLRSAAKRPAEGDAEGGPPSKVARHTLES